MSNPIKYSTGSESLALKTGNFYIGTGDVGKGPTSTTGYYNGITPPSGGYTIYLNKATGGPSIYTCANDTELINLTNSIAGTSYTTANECLVYFAGQSDKMVLNRDYEGIVTDGLVLNYDAGFTPSYPKNGTTWYDVSDTNNGTLTNGPTFSSVNGGCLVFDGTNDYTSTTFPVSNNSDFSIGIWVNLDSGVTVRKGIVSTWDTSWKGFGIGYGLNYPNMTIRSWVNDGAGGGMNWDLVSTYEGSFHYLVLTYSYSTGIQKGYIDSNYKVQETFIDSVTHSTFQIARGGQTGSSQLSSYSYMDGKISNLQVYNKVLSQSEITQNFNAQKGRFGL